MRRCCACTQMSVVLERRPELRALGIALSTNDRIAIYELIALHGHLIDAGEFDRLDEPSTEDFV